jgi:hypothetical protein
MPLPGALSDAGNRSPRAVTYSHADLIRTMATFLLEIGTEELPADFARLTTVCS